MSLSPSIRSTALGTSSEVVHHGVHASESDGHLRHAHLARVAQHLEQTEKRAPSRRQPRLDAQYSARFTNSWWKYRA